MLVISCSTCNLWEQHFFEKPHSQLHAMWKLKPLCFWVVGFSVLCLLTSEIDTCLSCCRWSPVFSNLAWTRTGTKTFPDRSQLAGFTPVQNQKLLTCLVCNRRRHKGCNIGCQSIRTHVKSYHADSYPSQLVPNTNSYPTRTQVTTNSYPTTNLPTFCKLYNLSKLTHNC